jgi:hypothetical protein
LGQFFQFIHSLVRLPQPQSVFGAPDPDGVRERELAFDGGWWVRPRFIVVEVGLRFDGRAGGFAQFLKSGDKFQSHTSWEWRQTLFVDVLGSLENKMITRRQDLDRVHEFLFSGFACFNFHTGSVAGGVGHWLTNRIIFREKKKNRPCRSRNNDTPAFGAQRICFRWNCPHLRVKEGGEE